MVQINDVLAKSIGNMNRSMNQSNPSNPSNPSVPSNPSYRVFKAEDQVGKEGKAKKVNINEGSEGDCCEDNSENDSSCTSSLCSDSSMS